jgi:hypothetical protein
MSRKTASSITIASLFRLRLMANAMVLTILYEISIDRKTHAIMWLFSWQKHRPIAKQRRKGQTQVAV